MNRELRIAWTSLLMSLAMFAYLGLTEPAITQARFTDTVTGAAVLLAAEGGRSRDCPDCPDCPRSPTVVPPRPQKRRAPGQRGRRLMVPVPRLPRASVPATPSVEISRSIPPATTPGWAPPAPGRSAGTTTTASAPPSAERKAPDQMRRLAPTPAPLADPRGSAPATRGVDASSSVAAG